MQLFCEFRAENLGTRQLDRADSKNVICLIQFPAVAEIWIFGDLAQVR